MKKYTTKEVLEFLHLQRHKCQREINKRSKFIDGVWYVACEDVYNEDIPEELSKSV